MFIHIFRDLRVEEGFHLFHGILQIELKTLGRSYEESKLGRTFSPQNKNSFYHFPQYYLSNM